MKLTKAKLKRIILKEIEQVNWRDSRNSETGMTLHEMVAHLVKWVVGLQHGFVDSREDEETLRKVYDALEKAEQLLK